jgi:DsbC/DsbD-like thiol-disulfide interchange protein
VLKLSLEFGVCREICIPATGTFDLSIPAAATGAPAPEIAAAIERVPRAQDRRRKADPDLRRVTVSGDGSAAKLAIEAAFAGDASSADAFVEAPDGYYVSMPKRVAADAGGVIRFETEIARELAQDLKGKTLTFTLVSDAGATEAQWIFP